MDDQQFVTTIKDAIPDGMRPERYMRCVVTGEFIEGGPGLDYIRERLVRQLGEEPAAVLLINREQAEWLFSESLPSMGPDDRMMIAVTLRPKEADGG